MSLHIENFFKLSDQHLPKKDLISSQKLVRASIAKSKTTLADWRKKGLGPDYIVLSPGQIRYIRSSVLEWLQKTQPFLHTLSTHTSESSNI